MKRRTERRKSPRKEISLPLTYLITQEPFKKAARIRAVTKDMSKSGLAFISSNVPDTLTIGLNIQLPVKKRTKDTAKKGTKNKSKKIIKTKARIVWSRPLSKRDKNIFTTGVCFLELNKADYTLLTNELEKIEKKKRKK